MEMERARPETGIGATPRSMRRRLKDAFSPAPIPRCDHCHRPVGEGNEIRERLGRLVIACATCEAPAPLQGEGCNCWVRDRPAEEQAELRPGAHDVRCPGWRPSLDPVDAAADAELRLRLDR
jgi:hypothetical protein